MALPCRDVGSGRVWIAVPPGTVQAGPVWVGNADGYLLCLQVIPP